MGVDVMPVLLSGLRCRLRLGGAAGGAGVARALASLGLRDAGQRRLDVLAAAGPRRLVAL